MYKILFADDDYKIAETVKTYFTANGFDVTVAENGRVAADFAELNDYDLIILDVMMPVLDGIAACREIRKTKKTPILFMSALGQEEDYLKGYSAGADDYITKPFPLSVLTEKCLEKVKSRGIDKAFCSVHSNIVHEFNVDGGEFSLFRTLFNQRWQGIYNTLNKPL